MDLLKGAISSITPLQKGERAARMIPSLLTLFLAPAMVTATSLEYYRSVFCDTRSSSFFLDKYNITEPMLDDKTCRQTPARTMAVKLVDELDPACVVLAYDDYACTSLVGLVPTNGQCIAAAKARIGSWRVRCDTTSGASATLSSAIYAPGELKRRGKQRLPAVREVSSTTTDISMSSAIMSTPVASSVASEISSAVKASASKDVAATITSSPAAGAGLSSAIESGTGIEYNLTAYVTAAPNSSYIMSTLKTVRPSSTVTFTGTRSSNGTATLYVGGSPSNHADTQRIIFTALCGALAIVLAVLM